ncbi:MAG: ABC transporter permease [Parasporobacterium sp.]|nr:ABC transporter permease [Parasporobacterium sp.]
MIRYIIRRLFLLIPILIGTVVIVFTINFFSDISPARLVLGPTATEEQVEAKEDEWGLNDPYLVQLGRYFWRIVSQGSLGTSYIYNQPVLKMIMDRLPNTLIIGLLAATLSVMIGIPLGILAAIKQNTALDYIATFLAILCGAIPPFVLCILMQLVLAVRLHWLPVSGIRSWLGYIMPIIACGVMPVAMTCRMTRSSMLETIRQDYIRTARAKGLKEGTVIWKHALKNALIPIITVVGMTYAMSLCGSIISEAIFNIPGLGNLMNSSISQKDYITNLGCVLVAAFIMSFVTLITDLIYAAVDPRIKAQYAATGKRARTYKRKEAAV